MHLWYERGTARCWPRSGVLDDGAAKVIGRVATAKAARGQGLAAALIRRGIELCAGAPIHIGAQAYLEGWYEQFGFRRSGPGYVEDGIPHVPMRRERRGPAAGAPVSG